MTRTLDRVLLSRAPTVCLHACNMGSSTPWIWNLSWRFFLMSLRRKMLRSPLAVLAATCSLCSECVRFRAKILARIATICHVHIDNRLPLDPKFVAPLAIVIRRIGEVRQFGRLEADIEPCLLSHANLVQLLLFMTVSDAGSVYSCIYLHSAHVCLSLRLDTIHSDPFEGLSFM